MVIILAVFPTFSKLSIGQHNTGDIYSGFDLHNGEAVALKSEPHSHRLHVLQHEYQIYKSLGANVRVVGLPEIKYFGIDQQDQVMVMQLLGPSLEKLFVSCGRNFSLPTILLLALQLVSRLKLLGV
jgi:serine/threonine protein kinase